MSFVGWCERCQAEGIRSPVSLLQINFTEAVRMCTRPACRDFLNFAERLGALFIKLEPSQCVNKAPASKPTKAVQSSSLSTARLSSGSGPPPLPTEGGPLSRTVDDQDAAREPAANSSCKVEAADSSVQQMASTSNNEAKAGDASEVCRGGKMLVAEAVTSPVPTGVQPFVVTGHHDLPAPPEATIDLSVSSRVDAGECDSEVSAEDPIVPSLRIAETMSSLQCGHPQVAKPSVDSGDSTAAWSQPQRASGVQFDRTEEAFRDDSPTDCREIEGGAHQSHSEGREYVDLRPCSPPLLAPSQGAPSSEQSDGTTLQAAAVIGPSAAPAQRTPAAVASTSGNAAAVTRPVRGRPSTGRDAAKRVVVAGTSSGSGRLACKPEVRVRRSWATSGRGAAASGPARPSKTRRKRGVSPPRPQAEATASANGSCYVVHKLAMITAALQRADNLPKYAAPRETKIYNKRLPGRKRKKDFWTKRQAGPQSARPSSPNRVVRLAFGQPPKIRRKREPEQVVPDVLHPAPSPTPSDNSSQSSKPSINCPTSPATSCVSSGGSDLSITNPGSSDVSSSSSSLQLVKDYYARQRTSIASGFPPYQFKETAPVTGAKRGRRPAKKGTVDVDAEVDRYVSELSACEDSSQYDSVLADLF